MNKDKRDQTTPKTEWEKPELVDLDLDLEDVKNGYNAGTDGAMPPFGTSLS